MGIVSLFVFVIAAAVLYLIVDSCTKYCNGILGRKWFPVASAVLAAALIVGMIICATRIDTLSSVEEYKAIKATYEAAFSSEYQFNNENIHAISEIAEQNRWVAQIQFEHRYWWNFVPGEVMELEPISIPE